MTLTSPEWGGDTTWNFTSLYLCEDDNFITLLCTQGRQSCDLHRPRAGARHLPGRPGRGHGGAAAQQGGHGASSVGETSIVC